MSGSDCVLDSNEKKFICGLAAFILLIAFLVVTGIYDSSAERRAEKLDDCKVNAVSLCDSYGMVFKNMYLDHGQDVMVQCMSDYELKEFEVNCGD